jgi:hypothetical protein
VGNELEWSEYSDGFVGLVTPVKTSLLGRRNCHDSRLLRVGAEALQKQFGGGFGIEDVAGCEPGAAELRDTVAHLVELFGGVGVGIDDDLTAVLFGDAKIQVAEVGPCGIGVVFNGHA